jgi:catechol 2,3-dioxygenase-like lactoylglutathione lyase family enzyme
MLNQAQVTANVPAADLDRARRFYSEKLGLTPASEFPGMLIYQTGGGTSFSVYETEFAGKAGHTIAQWHVGDVEAEVGDLQANGVSFEVYDQMPGVEWNGVVASIPGMGSAAWFKDSEGNTLCIDDGGLTG